MDLKSIAQDFKKSSLFAFDPLPDLAIRKMENQILYPFQEALKFLFSYTLTQFGFREQIAAELTDQIVKRFTSKLGLSKITRKVILSKKVELLQEHAVITEGGNKIFFTPVEKGFETSQDTIFVAVAIGKLLIGLAESWDELGGDQTRSTKKAKVTHDAF